MRKMLTVKKGVPSARALSLILSLVMFEALHAEETTINNLNSTLIKSSDPFIGTNEKMSRRLIDDRLTPPRATDFSLWNKRPSIISEVYRLNPSPSGIVETVDDNVTDNIAPKKTRTVTSTQDPSCCGTKSPSGANGFSDEDKSKKKVASEALDLERGTGTGPVPRFHGNNPNDDRYGQGWRTFNYAGYKDRGYYEQRNHHPYDRFGTIQRPSSTAYGVDGDRYGSSNRPGKYQGTNYGYGSAGGTYDRPRPGGSNFGLSSNVGGEGDSDYFSEGGSPTGGSPSNLQTQKAVALKALAGVALIGAAAALATNPVFLPIGVLSGRRKRSIGVEFDNYTLTALLQGYIQPEPNKVPQRQVGSKSYKGRRTNEAADENVSTRQELVITPECVARLACHVHRDYLDELEKTKIQLGVTQENAAKNNNPDDATFHGLENWFDSLIHNNILVSDYLSDELKTLIQSAVAVGSNKNASCDKFSCLNVHSSLNKKTT